MGWGFLFRCDRFRTTFHDKYWGWAVADEKAFLFVSVNFSLLSYNRYEFSAALQIFKMSRLYSFFISNSTIFYASFRFQRDSANTRCWSYEVVELIQHYSADLGIFANF